MSKLMLYEVKENDEGLKLYFLSFLRPDFVERSLVITLDIYGLVNKVYISSCEYGSVEWLNGSGLGDCRLWESEEQAESPSYLTRRYTTRLANGFGVDGYAHNILIPDVLDKLEDKKLTVFLYKILKRKKVSTKINFSSVKMVDLENMSHS